MALHRGQSECQGTRGRTQTYQVPHATQLVPVPVLLEGVTYQVNGDQFRAKAGTKRGKVAKGWSRTAIGSVSIPTAQLVITDVSSRCDASGRSLCATVIPESSPLPANCSAINS